MTEKKTGPVVTFQMIELESSLYPLKKQKAS